MPLGAPLIVAILISFAVMLIFMALWLLFQYRDPIEDRLDEYGLLAQAATTEAIGDTDRRYHTAAWKRFLAGFGLGPRIALALTRAGLPLTATEYSVIVLALGFAGLIIGTLRLNVALGVVFGVFLAALPIVYLSIRRRSRLRAFTEQLPDMLTLLVGALRAGYGLNQALDLVARRLTDPMSTEIANVVRAVNLGIPLQRALEDAVVRVGSEDFNRRHRARPPAYADRDPGPHLAAALHGLRAGPVAPRRGPHHLPDQSRLRPRALRARLGAHPAHHRHRDAGIGFPGDPQDRRH